MSCNGRHAFVIQGLGLLATHTITLYSEKRPSLLYKTDSKEGLSRSKCSFYPLWISHFPFASLLTNTLWPKICLPMSPSTVEISLVSQVNWKNFPLSDSTEIKVIDNFFKNFSWMFSAEHCFEKYNKKDRSPCSQKRYDKQSLSNLCLNSC